MFIRYNPTIKFWEYDTSGTQNGAGPWLPLPIDGNLLTGIINASSGIKFPVTQVPSADPNTLDDYEEGLWTPGFSAETTPPTGITYSLQDGRYVKVGKIVTASFDVLVASPGSGGNGIVMLTGFPFTNGFTSASGLLGYFSGVALGVSGLSLYFQPSTNYSQIYYKNSNATGGVDGVLPFTAIIGGTRLIGSITYMASN